MTVIFFLIGLAGLIIGAELFLKAVDRFGLKWGVPPLIMGLTVVAFATGAPELAISIKAAFNGNADLVLGNIIGSNIANILLILGITALISPITITRRVVRIDVPIVIITSIAVYFLAFDGELSTFDGIILLSGFIAYSYFTFIQIKDKTNDDEMFEYELTSNELTKDTFFYIKNIGYLLVGLTMIVLGSNWMVDSAVIIARILGLSELVIGLTIISIGTSLPEVATSLSAARKGNADIAVANVLGSNLQNMLLTLGLTLVIVPHALAVSKDAITFDLPFMVTVSIACIPIFVAGFNLTRIDGLIFLFYYVSYMCYLILDTLNSLMVEPMHTAMTFSVVPATILYMIWRIYKFRKSFTLG